jgi:predicted TIM-barrel fold metal-dependent hydrolase
MLNGHAVIDADSHIHDFQLDWPSLLPPELREVAPRTYYEPSGFPHIEVEGRLLPGGEHDLKELAQESTRDPRYWEPPRHGEFDATARLPDMDEMGIDVCVLFGGHCFLVASKVESSEVANATLRAYNEYLGRFCAAAPDRLKGVAMIAMQSPDAAAAELQRAVQDLGLVAAVLPPHHANGTMLDDPSLDPIWSMAQSLNVPVCVHTIGGQISPIGPMLTGEVMGEAYGGIPSMLALGHLILGGVLDRYPELTVCFLETGAGWVPYFMDRMQGNYEMFGAKSRPLRKTPAEYVRSEQLYFAADPDETTLPAVVDTIGADRLVIGSDYCHPEGMCPFTMKAFADRDDLSLEVRRKILYDNPKRLYRL